MAKAQQVRDQIQEIDVIDRLTQTFKGIASIYISRTKDQVINSKAYFSEIWGIYQQLRADPRQRITGHQSLSAQIDKDVMVVIVSESALTGDIDQKIMRLMARYYHPEQTDVIAIGSRGALQLQQYDIAVQYTYGLPQSIREQFDVAPVIERVQQYRQATVFYPVYQSLTVQQAARVDLIQAVQSLSEDARVSDEIISPRNYIFEPSVEEIIAYMENAMLQIAFAQFIFEARLAQFASRFNAMSHAHEEATDIKEDLQMQYNRTKRREEDERLKEIINTVQAVKQTGGGRL